MVEEVHPLFKVDEIEVEFTWNEPKHNKKGSLKKKRSKVHIDFDIFYNDTLCEKLVFGMIGLFSHSHGVWYIFILITMCSYSYERPKHVL
jgi:hypothetical protein